MNRTYWPRLAGLGGVVALLLIGISLPRPPSPPGPEFTEVIEPSAEASANRTTWYCPWINSGASRSTQLANAFMPDVDITFTHPDPRVGEPADGATILGAEGPGALIQDVAEIVNRGDAPGIVEFSDGPATATEIVSGDAAITGDRCVASAPKLWHIAGLTTREGYELTLRLFNPFPENAKVRVTASSELGSEALPDLATIDVVGRTWVDVDLAELIPFLDTLAVTVAPDEGTVIPAVVQGLDFDEASWSGTGLSMEWYFPTATLAGMEPRLAIWNPNDGPVEVEVDLFSRISPAESVFSATVSAGRPVEFPLADESTGAVGVRIRSTGPVAAAVVAEDVPVETPADQDPPPDDEAPRRIAGTIGAPQESLSWLLPGAGGFVGGETSIWLLNTTGEAVTVTIQKLGRAELAADKVRVEPGTFTRVRPDANANVAGYLVESGVPITASWSVQTADAIAMFAGVAIER